jgi:hypothetical protein
VGTKIEVNRLADEKLSVTVDGVEVEILPCKEECTSEHIKGAIEAVLEHIGPMECKW